MFSDRLRETVKTFLDPQEKFSHPMVFVPPSRILSKRFQEILVQIIQCFHILTRPPENLNIHYDSSKASLVLETDLKKVSKSSLVAETGSQRNLRPQKGFQSVLSS